MSFLCCVPFVGSLYTLLFLCWPHVTHRRRTFQMSGQLSCSLMLPFLSLFTSKLVQLWKKYPQKSLICISIRFVYIKETMDWPLVGCILLFFNWTTQITLRPINFTIITFNNFVYLDKLILAVTARWQHCRVWLKYGKKCV